MYNIKDIEYLKNRFANLSKLDDNFYFSFKSEVFYIPSSINSPKDLINGKFFKALSKSKIQNFELKENENVYDIRLFKNFLLFKDNLDIYLHGTDIPLSIKMRSNWKNESILNNVRKFSTMKNCEDLGIIIENEKQIKWAEGYKGLIIIQRENGTDQILSNSYSSKGKLIFEKSLTNNDGTKTVTFIEII